MSAIEQAPLLNEAFGEFVAKRDPIFAARPKSLWQLIKEAAKLAWETQEPYSFKETWAYAHQTASKNGFRRIKAYIYNWEFLAPLRTGDKKAYGQIVPRDGKSDFYAIDRAIWHEGAVDIPKSRVAAADVGYAGIRLPESAAKPLNAALTAVTVESGSPCSEKVRGKPGPKTAGPAISDAVDQLWADEAFRKLPRIRQFDRVKESIRGLCPEVDAVLAAASEKTLIGHVSKRVRELAGRTQDHS